MRGGGNSGLKPVWHTKKLAPGKGQKPPACISRNFRHQWNIHFRLRYRPSPSIQDIFSLLLQTDLNYLHINTNRIQSKCYNFKKNEAKKQTFASLNDKPKDLQQNTDCHRFQPHFLLGFLNNFVNTLWENFCRSSFKNYFFAYV